MNLVKNIKLEIANNEYSLNGIINNAAIQIVKPFETIDAKGLDEFIFSQLFCTS